MGKDKNKTTGKPKGTVKVAKPSKKPGGGSRIDKKYSQKPGKKTPPDPTKRHAIDHGSG